MKSILRSQQQQVQFHLFYCPDLSCPLDSWRSERYGGTGMLLFSIHQRGTRLPRASFASPALIILVWWMR